MLNKGKLVGITTGIFKWNHCFVGANQKIITALETEILYTSANQVSNSIKVIVFQGGTFEKKLSEAGSLVAIEGELRTFNKDSWGKRINEVFLFPITTKLLTSPMKQQNVIELIGEVCGDVNFKKRRNGRLVAETILKVKRLYDTFDYIPIVAFNKEAEMLNQAKVGQEISLKGRIHSRTFKFKYEEDGETKTVVRTALEVGIHKLEMKDESSNIEVTIETETETEPEPKASPYRSKIFNTLIKTETFRDTLSTPYSIRSQNSRHQIELIQGGITPFKRKLGIEAGQLKKFF